MPHRASVNNVTQIGIESTAGTSVAANRLLEAFTVQFGVKADVKTFRAQGRKYPSVAVENTEMVEGKFSGEFDYNAIPYIIHACLGALTLVAHSPSVTAFDWTITPALTGNYSPKTLTIEHGDSVRAEKAAYGLFSGFHYKVSRKEVAFDAPFFAQALTDNITLTASPTLVALLPAVGKHFNVYVDPTSGALGTTLMANLIELDVDASGYYTQFWPVNRTNVSWTAPIDEAPKVSIKMKLEADSVGMSPLANMQAGTYVYMRVSAVGQVIDVANSVNAGFIHDMALKVTNVQPFADADGVYAVEWTFDLAEDTVWTHAMIMSGTCALTAF